MGCNAWNHPPECNCGWGGDFYGKSASTSQALAWPMAAGSWINPNSHCPVCNAPVFFYRSPSGGKVYFDELGTPWPKHPCISGAREVPSSTYWRACDFFLQWKRKVIHRGGLKILTLSGKKFAEWFIEEGFMRAVRCNEYPPIMVFWVIQLPYAVIGNMDFGFKFELIKKPDIIEVAKRVQGHFEKQLPREINQKVCQQIALALLNKFKAYDEISKVNLA